MKYKFNIKKIILLYYLADEERPLTVKEIATATGLPLMYLNNSCLKFTRFEGKGQHKLLIRYFTVVAGSRGAVYAYTISQYGRDRLKWIEKHFPEQYEYAIGLLIAYQESILKEG